MKETLTAEEEALLDVVADEWIAELKACRELDPSDEAVIAGVKLLYGLYSMEPQEIEVYDSPQAAIARAKELGVESPCLDWAGIADAGWLAYLDFFRRIKVLTEADGTDDIVYAAYVRAGVFDSILLNGRALLIRMPREIALDDQGRLHGPTGAALTWRDDVREYAWHGVLVPERMILTPEGYEKDEIMKLPTEQRRALAERMTWEKFVEHVGATTLDTWQDKSTGLLYELLELGDEKLLKKQSPRLMDDSQPYYVEPVDGELRTAQAARKWQAFRRPGGDWLSVDECERDPELKYQVEA